MKIERMNWTPLHRGYCLSKHVSTSGLLWGQEISSGWFRLYIHWLHSLSAKQRPRSPLASPANCAYDWQWWKFWIICCTVTIVEVSQQRNSSLPLSRLSIHLIDVENNMSKRGIWKSSREKNKEIIVVRPISKTIELFVLRDTGAGDNFSALSNCLHSSAGGVGRLSCASARCKLLWIPTLGIWAPGLMPLSGLHSDVR